MRPRVAVHPRLFIWGPFEARLQQTDVSSSARSTRDMARRGRSGPWLNRPMRKELGLPSPEEQIGHAAHDFASLLGGARVHLTRAEKIDGVPTVTSRWLMRLQALLGGLGLVDALKPDQPWLGWARCAISRSAAANPAPEPRPALALRPRRMSGTRIEDGWTNPYEIFARDILKLRSCRCSATIPTRRCAAASSTTS